MTFARRNALVSACLAGLVVGVVPAVPAEAVAQTDWTSYLGGPSHTSFTTNGQITKQAAGQLQPAWKWTPDVPVPSHPGQPTAGLYSSPTVLNHVIYIGANTGDFYALDEPTGGVLWKRFLGFQPPLTCLAQGFVSTAAVVPVADSTGITTPVVYVAAPDGYLYAMDGLSGAIRWQSLVARPSSTVNDYFNWSSPTILGGRVYIGFSSNCDSPHVRGGLMEFDQSSGNLLATYYTVPSGYTGGGVWTSAAATSDAVYVSTGSATDGTPGDSFSMVKLDPVSLSRVAAWTVPAADRTAGDADFGSSPIVFNATVSGVVTQLVGACNKNGYFYAFRTGDFSAPLWRFNVGAATSDGGSACLAGGLYDGGRLFLAGNATVIRGVAYHGSVRQVDPATGSAIWELGLPANVLGAPSINTAGVIAAATHDYIPPGLPMAAYLIDSSNGSILTTINENNANAAEFSQPVFADEFLLRTTTNTMFAYRPPTGQLRVTSSPAVPTQFLVDGQIANTFGLDWLILQPGTHTLSFSHVQGYTEPPPQTVTVNSGSTTTVTGTFTQRGWLRVSTSPAVASQLTVDGHPMNDWGMWTDIPTGAHTVCFGAVANFNPPPCQSVTVAAGATTTITGMFTSSPGAPGQSGVGLLRVASSPAVPIQILLDGQIANSWALDWLEVAPGSHTLCFTHVRGFTEPPCQTVTVTSGNTTVVTANLTQRGDLRVSTSPPAAGVMSVDSIPRNNWGMFTDIPTGSHTVCFGQAAGFANTPGCQRVTVNAGVETDVTGTYS